jgi:hypothetical protein
MICRQAAGRVVFLKKLHIAAEEIKYVTFARKMSAVKFDGVRFALR